MKRCSKKECCKHCRYVKFKGTMTKWPVQNKTHTTQKHVEHRNARDIQKKKYLCVCVPFKVFLVFKYSNLHFVYIWIHGANYFLSSSRRTHSQLCYTLSLYLFIGIGRELCGIFHDYLWTVSKNQKFYFSQCSLFLQ